MVVGAALAFRYAERLADVEEGGSEPPASAEPRESLGWTVALNRAFALAGAALGSFVVARSVL